MNKNAIKKFATEARRELIARVSQRALKYGISEKEVGNPSDDSVNGHLLSSTEKKQRAALIEQIQEKGYEQVMEEVAYTWFNRFSALRFMEVNAYLPSRVRVFTDEDNAFKPQILTEAIHLELDGLDMEKVYAYKDANDHDELYKYLLITQCNALNSVLPGMFQKIADYTELLFPDNLLREGSVIQLMIELIPEEDWKDQVQIIGWLYQYYNSEKKDDVFAALKKNVKITKENIPAATQLFTPDWIVRYMVENSLGRLWLEGHPDAKYPLLPTEEEQSAYVAGNRDPEDRKWHYYLEEASQEPEVEEQLAEIRKDYAALTPEQLKLIDPCAGSGHILAYMFDVLMQIYASYGYTTRDAVASIVENNLYGLDIDDRAAQLAYFAVMMKARQYDRRFFSRGIQPHVYAIAESNHVDSFAVEYFCKGDAKLTAAMDTILRELHDAKEYGSIITVSQQDWDTLYARFNEIQNESVMSIYTDVALGLEKLVQVAEVLSKKYMAVVTNPPYMGSGGMSAPLNTFTKNLFPDSKNDMSTVCMEKALDFCYSNGYFAMINIPVWMSLSSYEKLRNKLLLNTDLVNMVHPGRGIFGSDFGTISFVIRKSHIKNYIGSYRRLFDEQGEVKSVEERERAFLSEKGQFYACQNDFALIPGCPIAYWASEELQKDFSEAKILGEIAQPKQGMVTRDNARFIRLWWEIGHNKMAYNIFSHNESAKSDAKWYPCTMGGSFRKWYGNFENVVNFQNDGNEIIAFSGSHIKNREFYFRESITWSAISISKISMRYAPKGFLPEHAGNCLYSDSETLSLLQSLCNSCVGLHVLSILSPTLNYNVGDIANIPVLEVDVDRKKQILYLVQNARSCSKADWDAFETSWDFQRHPLLRKVPTIAEAFDQWQAECDERFQQLKANEEELNRIFIDIYGLQEELTPEVEDKDVTVRKADLGRDIRSFISYAVGCMFGRYSLDVDGLAYAGGEWDSSKYVSFAADKDNILPICDDEYFEDDIVGRFMEFVKTVYGAETLDENLKFIADALGGKGQPKDVIRNYFLNDFYSDHCKIYQKRPIYWLFDSGKKNGFKALIYMHRYQPDTIARIRTDYVHEQQARYRTAIADLEARAASASTSERVKLTKQLKALNDQATEIHAYEEKIHHLADQMISIDLDDGVKVNYAKFQDVLAKIK